MFNQHIYLPFLFMFMRCIFYLFVIYLCCTICNVARPLRSNICWATRRMRNPGGAWFLLTATKTAHMWAVRVFMGSRWKHWNRFCSQPCLLLRLRSPLDGCLWCNTTVHESWFWMIPFSLPWHIALLGVFASVYWAEPQTSKRHRIHPDHKPWHVHLSSGSSRLPQALLWESASFVNCRILSEPRRRSVTETYKVCLDLGLRLFQFQMISHISYISFLTSRAQVLCRRRLPGRTAWMSSLRFLVAMKIEEQSFRMWGMTFTTPGPLALCWRWMYNQGKQQWHCSADRRISQSDLGVLWKVCAWAIQKWEAEI